MQTKLKKRVTFKIKRGYYYLERLTPEMMNYLEVLKTREVKIKMVKMNFV